MAIKTIDPQDHTKTNTAVIMENDGVSTMLDLTDKKIPCGVLADACIEMAAQIVASFTRGTALEARAPDLAADCMYRAVIKALIEKYEDDELNVNQSLLMIEQLNQND